MGDKACTEKGRDMIEYGNQDPLYMAIMDADEGAVSRLRERGKVLSDEVKYALTRCTGTLVKPAEGFHIAIDFEGTIQRALMDGMLDYFVLTVRTMRREVGEPLYFSNSAYWGCTDNFYDRAVFECILDCFDNRKINKKQNMIYAIDNDRIDLLEIAIAHDWLKMPRKRDEMIAYAESRGKTEIVAYLLDFKNRTADLAGERKKAEKKMLREMNAAPDSVSELKKIWSFKTLDDGNLIITGYKGKRTEVIVPEKIGKAVVTAIGDYAFSPCAPRLTKEAAALRENITKITLPESITYIGDSAFRFCHMLGEINLPDGVTEICDAAFGCCDNLRGISLPSSLVKLGKGAFAVCRALDNVIIPEGVTELPVKVFNRCTGLKSAVVPEGVTTIYKHAFADCVALEKVELPGTVTAIKDYKPYKAPAQTIFHNSPDVTVTVPQGSYAEKYCKKNKIKYVCRENKA